MPAARQHDVNSGTGEGVRGREGVCRGARSVREGVLEERRSSVGLLPVQRLLPRRRRRSLHPQGDGEGALIAVADRVQEDEVPVVAVAGDDRAEEVVGGPPFFCVFRFLSVWS